MQRILEKIGSSLLFVTLVIATITFPYSAPKHTYAPVELALSLQFGFLLIFLLTARTSVTVWAVIPCLLSFIILYLMFAAQYTSFHLYDFVMGLTPVIYLVLAYIGCNRQGSAAESDWLPGFITLIFFVFYIFRLLQGVEEPGFLMENNLELILFSAAAFKFYTMKLRDSHWTARFGFLFLVFTLFTLIDTKGYLVALVFALGIRREVRKFSILISLFFLYYLAAPVYEVWITTDRYFFLSAFLDAFSLLPQIGFELPSRSCYQLEPVLPRMVDRFGYCSSALFHGSVPRIFYDFGLIGAVGVFYFIFRLFVNLDSRFGASVFIYFFVAGIFISTFSSLLFLCSIFLLRLELNDTRYNT